VVAGTHAAFLLAAALIGTALLLVAATASRGAMQAPTRIR
jgi:hypothetical protein